MEHVSSHSTIAVDIMLCLCLTKDGGVHRARATLVGWGGVELDHLS
jgi:hypothetical protein